MTKLTKIYEQLQIDDPDQFKQSFDMLKEENFRTKKQLIEKTKIIAHKDSKLKKKRTKTKAAD